MQPGEILRLIDDANSDDPDARVVLEREFKTSERLAVYGSLAPGKQNHNVIAPLGGEWTDGFVEGNLFQTGWGAPLGYWAFKPRSGAEIVAVKVLTSPKLPDAWPMLDEFEGREYRRVLVLVRPLFVVANIYAAAESRGVE